MGEATHSEEHQNPHTNRRERIEEVRQRATDVQHSSRARRSINGSGGDPEKPETWQQQMQAIRRRFANQKNSTAQP